MTLVGRFLVARKQAMSAMMPSDTTNYALFIKAFKGQMNQKFDIFYFSSILVKCV